jgi:dihydrodipicolinate reductase
MDEFVTMMLAEIKKLQDELKGTNPEKSYDMDSVRCGQVIGLQTAIIFYLKESIKTDEHAFIEKLLNDMQNGRIN